MSSLSVPASGIAGHRAMAVIEARRMARHPVFVLGVALGFVVLGLYVVLVGDETGVPVALTLPLLGAFYIGLTSVIAAARLTRSTEVAVEAVATAPGTEARRTLALAATGIPPFLAGLVFSVALVVAAKGIGVAPQEWWFGTLPDWQVWSIVLLCPVACLDGALLGVLTGRWLRFRGASAMVVVALIVVSLLGAGARSWRPAAPSGGSGCRGPSSTPATTRTEPRRSIAGNPAAYLGYLLALGALAVLGAMWHDRTARTPRFRILVAAVAAAALAFFVLAATTGNHDNRDSDPIPSRVDELSARLWYLRRGVAWRPVLGACGAAAITAVLLARWPDDAFLLAPALLACCAAAAAFVYDEDALPVVAVTPRGAGWRRVNRLGVALVPLSLWVVVVSAAARRRRRWHGRAGGCWVAPPSCSSPARRRWPPDDSCRRPARCSPRWWRWPRWRR